MFNTIGHISWLGISAATIATQMVGALWFTALFGRFYARALGREGQPAKMSPIYIVGPLVCNLVTVIASAMILRALGVENLGDGIMFGAIIGLGFLTATTVNTGINPNIPRPFLYGAISGSYFLVAGILNGAILTMIG
jgi:hypothetical protein